MKVMKMNSKIFAKFLYTLRPGNYFEMWCEYLGDENKPLETCKLMSPYFGAKVHLPDFTSKFVVIEAGCGENAYAIPFKNMIMKSRSEVIKAIEKETAKYFKKGNKLLSETSYVYVVSYNFKLTLT